MRRILFVLLLLVSSRIFADDYYWISSFINSSVHYQSASAACYGSIAAYNALGGNYTYSFNYLIRNSDADFTCSIRRNWPEGSSDTVGGSVRRGGDGCPSDTVYDSTLGECKAPAGNDYEFCNNTNADSASPMVWVSGQCVEIWRQENEHKCKYLAKRDGGSVSKVSIHLDSVENGPIDGRTVAYPNISCSINVKSSQCTVNADGKGSECVVDGIFTGGMGGGIDDPKAQDCHTLGGCEAPDLTPKTDTNNQPCNYSAGSDGSQSCTSKQETKTSGSQNCGTANGVFSCDWKAPTSKGIDISTNISTSTNADGSTTSVKTDVSTKTVCTDMNVCTSSTTTTKTTTTKDGNGVVTSTQSTCSGSACGTGSASNGSGTGSGGTGEGEGGGDCVTAEECSDGSSPDTPKLDNVDDYQTTTQKFYDTVKSSPIATAVGNISAPDTGAAPTLTTPAIQALGGVSLDYGIIRDLKSTIDDVLQPTMKAFWCFVAIMIFLMA